MRAVIADSCVERWSPEQLQAAVAERARRTPEQVAFWQHAHGNDWQQVVNADTRLLRQLAQRTPWKNPLPRALHGQPAQIQYALVCRDVFRPECPRKTRVPTQDPTATQIEIANQAGI